MTKSITDGDGSQSRQENILEKELNLTEYERMIRRQHGIITDGDSKGSRNDSEVDSDSKYMSLPFGTTRQKPIASHFVYKGDDKPMAGVMGS